MSCSRNSPPIVSVIIPFYNVAEYIEESIRSILEQTYRNLDIILINDCSTDSSLRIATSFKQKDDRIRIINLNKNMGPGFSRNIGIRKSIGQYIYFLDADDYLDTEAIENLLNHITIINVDILLFNGQSFNDKSREYSNCKYFPLEEQFFKNGQILELYRVLLFDCFSACLKFYNADFLKERHIYFPSKIYGEDVEFWIRCLLNTNKIDYLNICSYYRRYRSNSIMTGGSIKNMKDRVDNFFQLLNICEGNQILFIYILKRYIPFRLQEIKQFQNKYLIEYTYNKLNNLLNIYKL